MLDFGFSRSSWAVFLACKACQFAYLIWTRLVASKVTGSWSDTKEDRVGCELGLDIPSSPISTQPQRVAMDVAPSITVSEMRQQLAVDLGLEANEMCLMLGDVELDSQKTLQDYGNMSEQTLRLVPLTEGRNSTNTVDDDIQNSDFKAQSVHQLQDSDGLAATDSRLILKVEPNPILSQLSSHDGDNDRKLIYI